MNIGIDIRCLSTTPRTGVGEYTYELLNSIFKTDTDNQFFLFSNSAKKKIVNLDKWNKPNIIKINKKFPNKLLNLFILFFQQPKIDRLLLQKKIEVIFSPNLNFTSTSKKTKFILTIHDLSFELFPEFFTLKQKLWHKAVRPKKQCQKADIILCPSENTKKDIVNYYKINPEKIKVIYPGISTTFLNINQEELENTKNKIKAKYKLPNNFILFLGTIEPRKNIIGIIEAYEKVYKKLPDDYELIIAGAGGWKNKKIYKKAKNSPLKNKIKFIGYVDSKEKPALYSLASIFVYPSFYEGFGLPILEALKMNTPIITSNRSSLPEITGTDAVLIDPYRPEEIEKAINYLIWNKNTTETKNSHLLTEKFCWKKSAKDFLKLL